MKPITRAASLFAAFLAPALALAQYIGTTGNVDDISTVAFTVLHIINDILVPVLFALAFIVFLYGVAKTYIFSVGDEGEREKGHKFILWGIIGFVVMISLWGIVNVVSNTFGLAGSFAPPPPRSTSTYGPAY